MEEWRITTLGGREGGGMEGNHSGRSGRVEELRVTTLGGVRVWRNGE